MRGVLVGGLFLLSACHAPDWRAQQIARAEGRIRAEVGGPAAQFLNVQLIGDHATGQTCGVVQATGRAAQRFIVYIDGGAGPYVEGGGGPGAPTPEAFYSAWENDCLAEGYVR